MSASALPTPTDAPGKQEDREDGYGATAEIAAAQGAEIIVHLVTGHLDAGRRLPESSVLVKVA